METHRPPAQLAVVIACYEARATVAACLESLERQRTDCAYETVLVESSGDGTGELIRQRFPWVHLVESATRCFAGDARNLAIPRTTAPVIAFLDADCVVPEDWVERVVAAHRDEHLLVGGVIDNAAPSSLLACGYHFLEFNLWLPGRGPAEIDEIAGCCLSLKREAFERYGPFVAGTYSSDTVFQWRLRADGHRVLRDPRIRVLHDGRMPLGRFLGHTVDHRRQYAQVLCRERRLGRGARLMRALARAVLPPALLAVVTARVLRAGVHRRRFIAALPIVATGAVARAWGEARGFLSPSG